MADTSRDRSAPCGLPGGLGLPAFPLRHGEVKSPMACVPQLLVKKSVEGRDSFPTAGVELRARVTQSGGDQSGVNDQGAPEVAVCCLQSWTVSHNGPPPLGLFPWMWACHLPAPWLSLPHPCRSPSSSLPCLPCPFCLSCGQTGMCSRSPIIHRTPHNPCQSTFSRCPRQCPPCVLQ